MPSEPSNSRYTTRSNPEIHLGNGEWQPLADTPSDQGDAAG